MDEAVPGFSALNRWFKEAAAEAMMRGNDCLTWTTPTGSKIVQRYMISSTKLIRTIAFGVSTFKDKAHYSSNRLTVFDDNGPKEVHKKKNKTALAANWTHSMDASVLQEAFHDFDEPFTTVHDCLYTTAPAMKAALKRLRQAFVTVTTYDALNQFVEDNELEISLPPIGDADVSSALASEYLFS
jgi:DNA-directed RNA polymerase